MSPRVTGLFYVTKFQVSLTWWRQPHNLVCKRVLRWIEHGVKVEFTKGISFAPKPSAPKFVDPLAPGGEQFLSRSRVHTPPDKGGYCPSVGDYCPPHREGPVSRRCYETDNHQGDPVIIRRMDVTWQDLEEEAALRTWEEAHHIFLRMGKSGDTCKMGVPELPECVFGESAEGIRSMAATRQLRRTALRWREMSGDW